jgi:hypothetical protein
VARAKAAARVVRREAAEAHRVAAAAVVEAEIRFSLVGALLKMILGL